MKRLLLSFIIPGLVWISAAAQTDRSDTGTIFGYRFGIGGGMGVSAISITDLFTYINQMPGTDPYNRLSEFSTAVEFFAAADIVLHPTIMTGVEYSFILGSHSVETGFGSDNYTFTYHMPLVLAHYLLMGEGYFFKLGGGVGYVFTRYEEDPTYAPPFLYTGGGIGGKIQAVGHTPFGDNLYAYIGAEMRFGFPGPVADEDGRTLRNVNKDVSFNFFSFGLKFGLMYYF
jgi:hypothetical protein